ncbi:TetR/AcrR family transcriptional regulator [Amycolatopsis alkalitolerans]|uniref:TetR/AcrR family transcriptional regulator n=1 Tax=Amycolatopsis alkalitolerans TaxID=2547244 RepID=A0A5C4LRY5_9PSEU|nr:TetR/AcrR family transcriptional regulator [Amycolatopsis alkalitolerans]TNC18873.1 TetR/AcrR family transcriptional regulator [Amycolatopsis alkalitolerans]
MAYHHGDLRRTLLEAAVEVIVESGPAAVSLRELARRAGVSHAAPAHHFRDKAGLMTALAAQGFGLLAEELATAGRDLQETGVAYIRFATRNRAHFEVMFRDELYHADDPEVTAAAVRASDILAERVAERVGDAADSRSARLAAWSLVHGFAALWLGGALPPDIGPDPETAARPVLRLLFGSS